MTCVLGFSSVLLYTGKHRSTLKTIQLIAVVTHPLLKDYGFAHILQPFIDDMNKLEKVSFSLKSTYP